MPEPLNGLDAGSVGTVHRDRRQRDRAAHGVGDRDVAGRAGVVDDHGARQQRRVAGVVGDRRVQVIGALGCAQVERPALLVGRGRARPERRVEAAAGCGLDLEGDAGDARGGVARHDREVERAGSGEVLAGARARPRARRVDGIAKDAHRGGGSSAHAVDGGHVVAVASVRRRLAEARRHEEGGRNEGCVQTIQRRPAIDLVAVRRIENRRPGEIDLVRRVAGSRRRRRDGRRADRERGARGHEQPRQDDKDRKRAWVLCHESLHLTRGGVRGRGREPRTRARRHRWRVASSGWRERRRRTRPRGRGSR